VKSLDLAQQFAFKEQVQRDRGGGRSASTDIDRDVEILDRRDEAMCYRSGFLSSASCSFLSCKFGIHFHLFEVSGTLGCIIFSCEFQHLCSTVAKVFTPLLTTVFPLQGSPYLPNLYST
jgi:hypothetical protein